LLANARNLRPCAKSDRNITPGNWREHLNRGERGQSHGERENAQRSQHEKRKIQVARSHFFACWLYYWTHLTSVRVATRAKGWRLTCSGGESGDESPILHGLARLRVARDQ
jgi:hypothetical protein